MKPLAFFCANVVISFVADDTHRVPVRSSPVFLWIVKHAATGERMAGVPVVCVGRLNGQVFIVTGTTGPLGTFSSTPPAGWVQTGCTATGRNWRNAVDDGRRNVLELEVVRR